MKLQIIGQTEARTANKGFAIAGVPKYNDENVSQIKIEVLCAAESPLAQKGDTQRFRRAGLSGKFRNI